MPDLSNMRRAALNADPAPHKTAQTQTNPQFVLLSQPAWQRCCRSMIAAAVVLLQAAQFYPRKLYDHHT
jgi:hypothetical protein